MTVGAAPRIETALDRAHDAMLRAGEAEAARRAFYAALAAAELVVVLEAEPGAETGTIRPVTLETEAGEIVLAFDTEARMAQFLGAGTPVAHLTGRQLAQMLAPQRLGLGLNLDVAPSSILLPGEVMEWIAEMSPGGAQARSDIIATLAPPESAPALLFDVLDARLAMLAGQGRMAYLAQAGFADGSAALVLGITEVPEPARGAVTQAVAEAMSLAGLAETALDVMFLDPTDPLAEAFRRKGFGYEIPPAPEPMTVATPGSDPDKPPRLT